MGGRSAGLASCIWRHLKDPVFVRSMMVVKSQVVMSRIAQMLPKTGQSLARRQS